MNAFEAMGCLRERWPDIELGIIQTSSSEACVAPLEPNASEPWDHTVETVPLTSLGDLVSGRTAIVSLRPSTARWILQTIEASAYVNVNDAAPLAVIAAAEAPRMYARLAGHASTQMVRPFYAGSPVSRIGSSHEEGRA